MFLQPHTGVLPVAKGLISIYDLTEKEREYDWISLNNRIELNK